jgi:ATP-dependent protease ClpP protease subunit
MSTRQWFRFEAPSGDPSVVDIHIIDFIGDWIDDYFGFGVTARAFVDQLEKLPPSVTALRVHINSPGGDVAGATNIANALRNQRMHKGRSVVTIVDGWAASAATLVMMAGDPVRIADNGQVFVHNPWTVIGGNAEGLRKTADELDTARASIITTYQWHSPLSAEELGALMDAETMMTADEAIQHGFATEKVEGLKAAASLDRQMLARLPIPDRYRERLAALVRPEPTEAPAPADAKDVIHACTAAGFPELAEDLLGQPLDAVRAALAQRKTASAAADARATEIRGHCALAFKGRPAAFIAAMAEDYIAGGMAVAQIKAQLTRVTGEFAAEIDTRQPADAGDPGTSWAAAIAKVGTRMKGA